MTEPRWDLIRRIRRQIADGSYFTQERLERAANRINERLTGGSESVTVGFADHDYAPDEGTKDEHEQG